MKNFSSSIQRRKRGTRTEYIARLTYYDKTGKRKGVSKSAATRDGARVRIHAPLISDPVRMKVYFKTRMFVAFQDAPVKDVLDVNAIMNGLVKFVKDRVMS